MIVKILLIRFMWWYIDQNFDDLLKPLLIYYPYYIVFSATIWQANYAVKQVSPAWANSPFPDLIAQSASFNRLTSSLSPVSDADTVILEEIQIHHKVIHPDSLQVHDYFKNLSEKVQPSWKKIFIDRSSAQVSALPNRTRSTSSLISIDLLTLIGRIGKKKIEKVEYYLLLDEKERYIEQHFDSTLVKRLTGLSGTALSEFVRANRPLASDLPDTVMYELMKLIKSKHDDKQIPTL